MLKNSILLTTYSIIKNDKHIILCDKQEKLLKQLDMLALNNSDMGKLYERYVGLFYESHGYTVKYNGLLNGKLDGGIDLVCESKADILLVQCKYTHKSFGRQKIEQLLYNTSGYFKRNGIPQKFKFIIVVPNIDDCFSKKNKEYLLHKNNFISNGKIVLKEINFM